MAAALIAVKAAVLFAIGKSFGMPTRKALKLGLLLSQGGEFGFVLFAEAQRAMLVAPEAASLFGAIVTVSMASTPFLMKLNDWMDRRNSIRDGAGLAGPEESAVTSAIVVGYGRFGQTVGQMLMAKGISVTLIDSKPSQIETAGDFGMKVYYGDGTRLDLLRIAGAPDAEALFFCIDGNTLTKKKLEPILEAFPQAAVFIRVFDRLHVMELEGIDSAGLYREVYESAVCMGREGLIGLGVEEAEARRVEQEYRDRDRERLARQSASGDLHDSKHMMFRPEAPMEGEEPVTG
jgi:glutathione-regulated potassium-efflux system protein KefB